MSEEIPKSNLKLDPFTGLPVDNLKPRLDPFTGGEIVNTRSNSLAVKTPTEMHLVGDRQSYFDYDVNVRPGVDIEEQRGQNQGLSQKVGYGLAKMAGTIGTTALEGTVGLANGAIEAALTQDPDRLWNNTTGKYVDEFSEWMQETMPHYYTKAENEAIGFENFGHANFWSDKFTRGVGYAAGALLGGYGAGKALSMLGKGASFAAKGLNLGPEFSKAMESYTVMKAMQAGTSVPKYLEQAGRGAAALNATKTAAVGLNMAHAEAAVEARDMFRASKEAAINAIAEREGIKPNQLNAMQRAEASKIASRASNQGYMMNLAVLYASNLVQFGNSFRPKFNSSRMKGISGKPGQYVDDLYGPQTTRAGRAARALLTPAKDAVTEMGQEGTQFLISRSAEDISGSLGTEDWVEALGQNWANLDSKEGIESLLLGALIGGSMSGGRQLRNKMDGSLAEEKGRRALAVSALNSAPFYNFSERAKAAGAKEEHINEMNEALRQGDHKAYRDAQFAIMINDVLRHENLGTLDHYLAQIEDAGNMSKEDFAKAFNIPEDVDFEPKEITSGILKDVQEFAKIKKNIDTLTPGKPASQSIGDWIFGKTSKEEKARREDEHLYRQMLYRKAWLASDVDSRIGKLVDEINAATQGEAISEENLDSPITKKEVDEVGQKPKSVEELMGSKPYISMTEESIKKITDSISRINDPILREITTRKQEDLISLSADKAKTAMMLEELMGDPGQRLATIEREKSNQKAKTLEKLTKRADEKIASTITSHELDSYRKTPEFKDLPEEVQGKVAAEVAARSTTEHKYKTAHSDQSLEEMTNRMSLLKDIENRSQEQNIEMFVLQESINNRKKNPHTEPTPAPVEPSGETKEETKEPKVNEPNKSNKAQKSRAAKHTKAFRSATDTLEKLSAAALLGQHFEKSRELGINSMLDPDVLLEAKDFIDEAKKDGYEITKLRGEQYDGSLSVEAEVVLDESLKPGEAVITRVNKPEIRLNGEVIQVAKVLVAQSPHQKGTGENNTDVQPDTKSPNLVKLRPGEFKREGNQVVFDDTGNPVPGVDSNLPVKIDRSFVKTPEGVQTLREKGVEFRLSEEYIFPFVTLGGTSSAVKGSALIVYVAGTDTAIGFLPSPAKSDVSKQVAEMLKTQDSVPGKVTNFSFGGKGNLIQGQPHVPMADVVNLETDSIAAIGVVREQITTFGQPIQGRDFGPLEARRLQQKFVDGSVVMAIQYPNGQYGTIGITTEEVGQKGLDTLMQYLKNPEIGSLENIKNVIGLAGDFIPGKSNLSITPTSSNELLVRFELGEYVYQLDNKNIVKMMNNGRMEFKVGTMVPVEVDGLTKYRFEEAAIDNNKKLELEIPIVGGERFADIVKSARKQVDKELLQTNPKQYSTDGIKVYDDYYSYLMQDVLLTNTRFVDGLPAYDVGIDFEVELGKTPEEAVQETVIKKEESTKRKNPAPTPARNLKPKSGKRPRRGEAKAKTTTEDVKAENVTEIEYKGNTYLVTFEGLGGTNTVVNKKSGKEILTTSSVGKNVMDLWTKSQEEGDDYSSEQVAWRLSRESLSPQEVLFTLLEKYGFEITEAENLLINLASRKIELNSMDNAQVAEALATPLAKMIQESDDYKQIAKAISTSKEYKDRVAEARKNVKLDRFDTLDMMMRDGKKVNRKRYDKTTRQIVDKQGDLVINDIVKELLQEGFDKRLAAEAGISPSLYKRVKEFIDKIIDAIRSVMSKTTRESLETINTVIQKTVNNSFLQGEFIRIGPEIDDPYRKRDDFERVSLQKAFDGNDAAKQIQTELSKNENFVLTGSIAFAAQGTAYRRSDNTVHDLDYVILDDIEGAREHLMNSFPAAERVYNPFDPSGEVTIETYLVPPKYYKLANIQRWGERPNDNVPDRFWWRKKSTYSGKVIYYEIQDAETDEVVGTFYCDIETDASGEIVSEVEIKEGVEGMLVDLFSESKLGLDYVETPFKGSDQVTKNIKISRYDVPFGAKLKLGRFKDIWDYNRFMPNKQETTKRKRRTIDPEKSRKWVEDRFGEGSAVIFDTVQKVDGAIVHGYMENAAVHLFSNAEIGTEYHEGFHLFFRTMLTDAQRAMLYDEAVKMKGEPTAEDIAKARRGQTNLSNAEARALAIEERLAEDFRLAQLADIVKPETIGRKIAKFFKDLMYYIKSIVTDRIGVQQAFNMLGNNSVPTSFARKAEAFSPGRAFMMKNYALDSETHRELVDTAVYIVREASLKGQLDVEVALGTEQTADVAGGESAIRDWFLRHSYQVQLGDDVFRAQDGITMGRPLTNTEFKQLKEAYDSRDDDRLLAVEEELNLNAWAPPTDLQGNPMGEGLQGLDPNMDDDALTGDAIIDRAEENAMEFRMVYDYWHDEFNELGGRSITGFRSDIKDSLKATGIKISDSVVEEETDEGADKVYSKTHFSVDPSTKLGGEFKILLSTIPVEKAEQGRFGFRRYMYWKDTYNELAGTVANSSTYVEMLDKIRERSNEMSNMKHVYDWMRDLPANNQALLFSVLSQSMNEFRLIIHQQNEDKVEAAEPYAQVKIVNSSISSNQRYFRELWKDNATGPEGVYVESRNKNNNLLDRRMDQDVAQSLQNDLAAFDASSNITEQAELAAKMMMDMGLKIAPTMDEAKSRLKDFLTSEGIGVNDFLSNYERHTNLRQIITDKMAPGRDNYENVFVTEGSTMDYIAKELMNKYEAPKLSSFYNAFGELVYPLNLTTDFHLTERSIKNGSYGELMLNAVGSNVGKNNSFARALAINPQFQEAFSIVDIEAIKFVDSRGEKVEEYKGFDYQTGLAVDLAMFNRDADIRMIAVDTQADRNKLSYAPVPNMGNSKFRNILGAAEFGPNYVDTIARRTYLLDLHRMFVSIGMNGGQVDNSIMRYHEGALRQFQLGGEMPLNELFTNSFDIMHDAFRYLEGQVSEPSEELTKFLDTQVYSFKARLESYKQDIVDNLGGTERAIAFIANTVEPKNGYIKGSELEFLKNFVEMSTLGRLTTREYLRSGINYTKDGASYVKRSGHSSTPGYLLALQGELNNELDWYGMPQNFREVTVSDLFTRLSDEDIIALRDGLAKSIIASRDLDKRFSPADNYNDLGPESKAEIDKLVSSYLDINSTDAQAFISIEMHRFIQMGMGKWDPISDEENYQKYIATPKGQRVWTGKPIMPYKPSYDYRVAETINGYKHLVPVVHKNSYIVLTEEIAKGIPNLENLVNFFEENDVQVANTETAKKLGGYMPSSIDDLSNARVQTLPSQGLKFPQILPNKKQETVTFGRQPRKNMVANIHPDTIYTVAGNKINGNDMLDLYFGATVGRLNQGHDAVLERLGYLEVLEANTPQEKEAALGRAVGKIREVVHEMGMEKDFPMNFIDSLELTVDQDGNLTSGLPYQFPVAQTKLESLIMAMFRRDAYLMRLPGKEMVQFAEFGPHVEDKSLKFYEVEGDNVTAAQVDVRRDVLAEMGIDPDASIEVIQEGLDELLAYRIPQQAKSSMYILKIRNVLPASHDKAIRVPAPTTVLMGSDFDVDKLFVIFPEAEVIRDEEGKAVQVRKVKPDYKQLLAQLKTKEGIDFSSLDPKVLNNIVFDTFYAIGSNVTHLTETTAVMDLDVDNDPILNALTLIDRPTTQSIDINSPHDRLSSAESNMLSMRLRGIYANAIAGRNVMNTLATNYEIQFGEGTIWDRSTSNVYFKSVTKNTKLNFEETINHTDNSLYGKTDTGLGSYFSDQLLSMYLSKAVDSVNDPVQALINDNAVTAPITVLMLTEDFTPQQAILFLNIPAVKSMTEQARTMGVSLQAMFSYEGGPPMAQYPGRTQEVSLGSPDKIATEVTFPSNEEMIRIIKSADAGNVIEYDEGFYRFVLAHLADKASRLQNLHSILNPDNIDQKGTIPLHQEMLDKGESLRDDVYGGAFSAKLISENILPRKTSKEKLAYPVIKGFYDKGKLSLDVMSDLGFISNQPAVEHFKGWVKSTIDKQYLSERQHRDINKMISHHMFTKPGSPIFESGLLDYEYVDSVFFQGGLAGIVADMRNAVGTNDNIVLTTLPMFSEQIGENEFTTLKFNIAALDDPNLFTAALEEMILNPEYYGKENAEAVRAFTKAVISNSLITSGFVPGPTSYFAMIPKSYWASLTNSEGVDLNTHFNRDRSKLDQVTELEDFKDEFLYNYGTHRIDGKYMFKVFTETGIADSLYLNSKNEFVVVRDVTTNNRYLFQLFDLETQMYKMVKTKGSQYKFNEANLRSVSGERSIVSLLNKSNTRSLSPVGSARTAHMKKMDALRNKERSKDIGIGEQETPKGANEKIDRLRQSFENAGVTINVERAPLPSGIKGEVVGNTITIDPAQITDDTVYHEFGHIYLDLLPEEEVGKYIKQVYKLRPDLVNKVKAKYPSLSGSILGKEVLATAIGIEGAKIERKNPSKLRILINKIMRAIGKVFGISPDAAAVLAENMFASEIRAEKLVGSFSERVQRSIDLQDRIKEVYNQVSSTLRRQQTKLEKQQETEEQIKKLREIDAQLNTMELISEKVVLKQKDINDFLDFQQYVLNKSEAIRNTIDFLKETEHTALTRQEILVRLNSINSLREDIDSLFSTDTENSTVFKMSQLLESMEFDNPEAEEVMKDLSQAGRELADSRKEYLTSIIPMLSKYLISFADPEVSRRIQELKDHVRDNKDISGYRLTSIGYRSPEFTELKAEYKRKKGQEDRMTKEEFRERALEIKLRDLDNKIPGKRQLDEELRNAKKQKSIYAALLDPIVYSSEQNIQLLSNALKSMLQSVTDNTIDYTYDLEKVYDEFKAHMGVIDEYNVAQLNEPITTTKSVPIHSSEGGIEGYMQVASYVERYETKKYYSDRAKAFREAAERTNKPKYGDSSKAWEEWNKSFDSEEYYRLRRVWYRENSTKKEGAEAKLGEWNSRLDAINAELSMLNVEDNPKDRDKRSILFSELRSVEKAIRDSYGEDINGPIWMGELSVPNEDYESEKWKEIQKVPAIKNYYDFIIADHFATQKKVGKSDMYVNEWDEYSYQMPSMRKDFAEGFQRGNLDDKNTWINNIKELGKGFVRVDTDHEFGVMTEVDGDRVRHLPRYYTNKVPAADVSLDVAAASIQFHYMGESFKEKSKMAGLVAGMIAAHEAKGAAATTPSGGPIIDTFKSSKFGKVLATDSSRELQHLKEWLDANYYGEKEVEQSIGNINLNKAAGQLMTVTALNSLSLNTLQMFNQGVLDNHMSIAEAHAAEHYSKADWLWGVTEYGRNGMAITDVGKMTPQTKLGKALQTFDALVEVQEKLEKEKLTSSLSRKFFRTDTAFGGQSGIEHQNASVRMLAVLKAIKPVDKDGEPIVIDGQVAENLWDALVENDKGRLVIDPRVANVTRDQVMLKLHGISKRTNQVKGQVDSAMANRNWFTKMLMMFRNYLPGNLRKKFGFEEGYHVDHELADIQRGMYPSVVSLLNNIVDEKAITGGWAMTSEVDKRNSRRAGVEAAGLLTAMVMYNIFKGMADDDDEDYTAIFLAYQAKRLQTELTAFLSLPEFVRMTSKPIATSNAMLNWWDLGEMALMTAVYQTSGMFEDSVLYQRRAGRYNKGDLKLYGKLNKTLPAFNGLQTAWFMPGSEKAVADKLKWFNQ